jgi:hypothetical protein
LNQRQRRIGQGESDVRGEEERGGGPGAHGDNGPWLAGSDWRRCMSRKAGEGAVRYGENTWAGLGGWGPAGGGPTRGLRWWPAAGLP